MFVIKRVVPKPEHVLGQSRLCRLTPVYYTLEAMLGKNLQRDVPSFHFSTEFKADGRHCVESPWESDSA